MKKLIDLDLILETDDFLAVNKPNGLLSQSDRHNEENTHDLVRRKFNKKAHLLTRLDRPVSGVLFFSKNKRFTQHFQGLQSEGLVEKQYLAFVQGKLVLENKEVNHFIYHDKKHFKARVSDTIIKNYNPCQAVISSVKVLDNYSAVSVKITNGQFHQIRAQLSFMGHTIKGDVKYGARRSNKDRSIHLHCQSISFKSLDGDTIEVKAPIPQTDNLWKELSH